MKEQNENIKLCFIGGDERQKYAAEKLSLYFNVTVSGENFNSMQGCGIKCFDNPLKALYGATAIILPLPATRADCVINIEQLIENVSDGVLLFGGKFTPYMKGLFESNRVRYIDYYDNECFALKNAYLTAEGALYYIMNKYPKSLRFSSCAVFGYGKIGKALSRMLRSLNASVTVWARREESLALALENGFSVQPIDEKQGICLSDIPENYDIIFNTVPSRIISNEILLALSPETYIVELASLPGGFDIDIAKQCNLNVIEARGIPGKYAPVSAGNILADIILKQIKREVLL